MVKQYILTMTMKSPINGGYVILKMNG